MNNDHNLFGHENMHINKYILKEKKYCFMVNYLKIIYSNLIKKY